MSLSVGRIVHYNQAGGAKVAAIVNAVVEQAAPAGVDVDGNPVAAVPARANLTLFLPPTDASGRITFRVGDVPEGAGAGCWSWPEGAK